MKIKNLFSEYYTLSYYPSPKTKQTKDINVKPYMILRIGPTGWNVLNLWNGTSILFPWRLIDIFLGLNVWGGSRLLGEEPKDKVEKVIQSLLSLIQSVERRRMEDFLKNLGDVLGIGIKELREWVLSETGEKLSPIEINSLDKYKEL